MTTLAPEKPSIAEADGEVADRVVPDVALVPPFTVQRGLLGLIAVLGVVGSIWGLWRVDINPSTAIEGWDGLRNLLGRMWPPTIAAEDRGTIVRAVLDTFFMAFAGTAIGVFLALPLAFLAAQNVVSFAPVRIAARAIIVFTRAVPTIVFALIFVRVFGIGVIPGIFALGIHSVGMIAKLVSDAIEEIEVGPREGVLSTGAGRMQELATGIWSQITPTVIAVSLYRLEIDFRAAQILGFVGAGGIGVILRGYQGNLRYPDLLGVTIIIVVLVIAMEVLSALTRRAILGTSANSAGSKLDPSSVLGRRFGAQSSVASSGGDGAGLARRPAAIEDVPLSAPWTRDRIKLHAAGWLAGLLLVLSFIIPDISASKFFGSLAEMPSVFWRLVPKNMDWLTSRVVSDMVETIAIGFAATFMALIVAVPLAFLAASNTSPGRWVYRASRTFALLLRAAPEIVLAVLLVVALGLGPAAGSLALAIGLVGFAIKLFADNIEEVRQGPRDGVFATGATRSQEVGTGVVPQVAPALIGNMLYVLDISIRSSTILGIVGAGGIGFLLNNAAKTLRFETMGGIILCIFLVVYAIELLSGWVRRQVL